MPVSVLTAAVKGQVPAGSFTCSTGLTCKCSRGPMPDNMRSCGEFTEPPLTMTSFLARVTCSLPSRLNCTPNARLVTGSIRTLVTWDSMATCRFFLRRAGLKNALPVLQRVPRRVVPCAIMKPVWNSPLMSLLSYLQRIKRVFNTMKFWVWFYRPCHIFPFSVFSVPQDVVLVCVVYSAVTNRQSLLTGLLPPPPQCKLLQHCGNLLGMY